MQSLIMILSFVVFATLLTGFTGATRDFQCWNFKSTNELREKYLDPINNLRRQILEGTAPNLPQDPNVQNLNWDCVLELEAEKTVETCDENTPGPSGLSQFVTR
ncbi:hypothetical protein RB195_013135 [Necator americanus]|uniref:SCP domain-containing protein n=1 Tax=Necator americanus TaxID=51031 RepID=A0ABR1DU57_NECAM